jgi:hypothetical protein
MVVAASCSVVKCSDFLSRAIFVKKRSNRPALPHEKGPVLDLSVREFIAPLGGTYIL